MILIKELLPNPTGSDEQGEWIRLINDSGESASTKGLTIADESGKTFSLSAIGPIAPGETIELGRSLTKIALNNDGDTIFLRTANGEVVDELTYSKNMSEGEIVTADKFMVEAPVAANSLSSGQAGFGTIDYSPGLAPVAVGLALALVAGALAWYVAGKINPEEDEKIYD
ncbi:MAG: lamin tail domain-containing protein [Dehalococcoidia bacterium]|nr:lamin tail domain-containing protein [Dehalococcoidia bacterium]